MYKLYQPEKIYLEKAAGRAPLTREILARLPDVPVIDIESVSEAVAAIRKTKDPVGQGKRHLLLAYDRGRSFKPFPESENYLSCDYHTLHLAEGCDLECSYCILQAYLTNSLLTVYVNLDEILANLSAFLKKYLDRFFRIGTGQLADSLSLDHITGFSKTLIPFFAGLDNAVLELKTKSTNIAGLLPLDPAGRTIVSWSMNSEKIQREEEHKCASLEEKLAAAEKILRAGSYRVGFHFDPIIDYPGWEKDYSEVIEKLFNRVPAERMAWISLGALRMMPELKPIMQQRFPRSTLPQAEWIRGMDGKLRYFKPKRIEIYKTMTSLLRRKSESVPLYLSMETPEVWREVFGETPTKESVCTLLDNAGRTAGVFNSVSP